MNMLSCSNLKKIYQKQCVVNDLSFSVKRGEVFALLGSNGAGKTTTIKMILDLIPKDAGNVEIQEGIRIGYSPETPYFHPFLSGREVLEFYGGLQKIPKEELKRQIPVLLERTGLEECKIKVKNYSKGMLQRLALAQALLGDPEFLILDEPSAGLDALGRVEMMHTIQRLKEEGKTILINSHILNDIERVCDRGIIMKKGSLLHEWEKGTDRRSLEEIFVEKIGGAKRWES
ncbi:ABC transporter ATP-binding protein [Clostridium sp. D5]|uniref:ABC transporter ATP-binding protein n=1 Tax=Clostridium sp. D5 TaxID=556261 RepID=UPI0002D42878|nr:ABC transporter ATP-binding protein [Clostridium sp. D5]